MDLSNTSEIKFVIYEFKVSKWISLHTRLMDDFFFFKLDVTLKEIELISD